MMKTLARISGLVLVLPWLAAAAAEEDQCSVYLAESSTSEQDEPKWGLFAGKRLEAGSVMGNPEVAIQTFNMWGNSRTKMEAQGDNDSSFLEDIVVFLEQFTWVSDSSGGKFELEDGRTVAVIPGAGVLGSYNAELTNSDWSHRDAYFRPPLGEEPGVAHPGRGASSSFFHVTQKVKHTIPAGMEIFVDYGENYEKQEEDEKELSRKDFDRIDTLVDRIIEFYDEFEGEMTPEAKSDIYNFLIKDVVGAAAGAWKGRKISQLLPADPEGLREMKKRGGSFLVNKQDVHHDVEWLQTNGLCMDNIKVDASTIPHAGRGAFAARPIKKGGLVSPVPLIHIPDKKVMDMHEIGKTVDDEDDPLYFRASDEVTGQQLLINYCFGHPESSLILFPAGSAAAYINHNSKPNAKVVWSSHPKHRAEWLDLPLKDLIKEDNQYVGLMFEIVATRNIKEGEEVFIDYGKDWEKAWKEHVKTWNQKVKKGEIDSAWPLRALDMNAQHKSQVFKTAAELEKAPYPENVKLMCFLVVEEPKDHEEKQDGVNKRSWTMPETGTAYDAENLFECKVLERATVEQEGPMPYNYTVMWREDTDDETTVDKVPHDALVFVDKAGTSDQFVQDAFRHYIGIPDEIFPKGAWRDLA